MNIKEGILQAKPKAIPRIFKVRGVLYLYISLLFLFVTGVGRSSAQATRPDTTLTASLITCWPGSEIYELCGHAAVRIKGAGVDSVWNFGLFDFNEPNFVYRFVKGETDYNVAGYPFRYFLPEYVAAGRRVEEQELNLTPEQTERLRQLLQRHSLPPYNRYRYNYIKNNCSTQIADVLDEASGGKILYRDSVRYTSYRDEMRDYHRNYPWYQFGIDLALGSGLEENISQREELFVPVEFYRHAASAFLPDGTPLVARTNVLNEGSDDAVLGPTEWYVAPWFLAILVLCIAVAFAWHDSRRKTISKWWYAIYFGVEGLAGCLIFFLVFISVHEATAPNILIFWLNPLQLIIPAFIWSRKTSVVVTAMMWLNICAVGLMILSLPFYVRGQGGQWAFLPLMLADFLMAVCYLYVMRVRTLEQGKRGRRGAGRRTAERKKKNKAKRAAKK